MRRAGFGFTVLKAGVTGATKTQVQEMSDGERQTRAGCEHEMLRFQVNVISVNMMPGTQQQEADP